MIILESILFLNHVGTKCGEKGFAFSCAECAEFGWDGSCIDNCMLIRNGLVSYVCTENGRCKYLK